MSLYIISMQHIFEFAIKKKPGSSEPLEFTRIYVTESNRKEKVGRRVKRDCIRAGLVKEEEIEDLYLHQLR